MVSSLVLAVMVGAALLTRWVLRYASAHQLQDVPNERSLHAVPTPRGGGLAIVLMAAAGWTGAALMGILDARLALAAILGGSCVAAVGLIDDYKSLSPRTRLYFQFGAAGLAAVLLGFRFSWLAPVVVLYIVWMTNLYNFMDGIDGIAAGECVSVSMALAFMSLSSQETGLAAAYLVLAASAGGFLFYNWQPARIFMGDVGSGFLGFCFAVLSLAGARASDSPLGTQSTLIVALTMMGVFIVDSGVTLVRRILGGEKISQAHRDHAYQKVVRAGWGHGRVTSTVILINLFWLAPLAYLESFRPDWRLQVLALAYAPLVAVALYLKAGVRQP